MARLPGLKRWLRRLAWLAAALALGLALLLVVYWAPSRPLDELKARWAPPPSTFLAIDGMQVHLRDEGPRDDPAPILLLHGTSDSLHTWDGWVPPLVQSGRRVIRVDLPGFGLTGPFPDGDHGIAAYPRFLSHLLVALGVQRVSVAGNSFGGQVALELALAEPERVERLVLVDALAYPRSATKVPIGFVVASLPGVNRVMDYVLPRSLVEDSVRSVYGDPSRVTPALVDRYYELSLREGNRAALRNRFGDLPDEADAQRVKRLRLPVLLLWGGQDQLIPIAASDRFLADIPGSRRVVFPGLGHVPHQEDPQATVVPVLDFLREGDQGRR
ncbi:MAG: alpha/beta hydrolase [Arenimonas sp.]|nr:alpha/beta hydrolase [Arenimonas sp.]